jgi:hypothetical protein
MIIKQINFDEFHQFSGQVPVLFVRPLLCKTVRVYPLHQSHKATGNYEKIIDLLNMTASRFAGGIYFYYPHHNENLHIALQYLYLYKIENFLIEKDSPFGYDQSENPIAEILN